jgi:aldehyde dehydrogenase (NAD+)
LVIQICVAPDYILVPRAQQDAVVAAFKKAYQTFWPHPKGALDPLSEMGAILNPHHHARLTELLGRTQGTIAHGGNSEGTKRIEPTVVTDVKLNDALMEECVARHYTPSCNTTGRLRAANFLGQSSR